jgi:hypothetical protein
MQTWKACFRANSSTRKYVTIHYDCIYLYCITQFQVLLEAKILSDCKTKYRYPSHYVNLLFVHQFTFPSHFGEKCAFYCACAPKKYTMITGKTRNYRNRRNYLREANATYHAMD